MTIAAIRPDSVVMPSTPRVTPTVSTGRFKQTLQSTVVAGAESAMTHLPGGPMMAVALRNGASSLGVMPGSIGADVSVRSAAIGSGTALPEGSGTTATGALEAGAAQGVQGTEGALAQAANDNMAMLRLQFEVQREQQHFTCNSNVMKARHESIKNAISNIR